MAKKKKHSKSSNGKQEEGIDCHRITIYGIAKTGKKYMVEFDAVFPKGSEIIEVAEKLIEEKLSHVDLMAENELVQSITNDARRRVMEYLAKFEQRKGRK